MSEINACCLAADNLVEIERREDTAQGAVMIVRRCIICWRRHYEMLIDPISLDAEIATLGGE